MNVSPSSVENLSGTLPRIGISVLGAFRLAFDDNPVPIGQESKAAHLLLCLVLARPHRLSRTQLLERIWPQTDLTLAGQSLNSLIHSLHKLTRPFLNGKGLITYDNGYYELNGAGGIWIDVEQFEEWSALGQRLFANDNSAEGVIYCQQALALYRGHLCGDTDLQTLMERERLRVKFLGLLTCLADHHYAMGKPLETLDYLQRLVACDPCREDAHRQIMCCYMQIHQRAQALRQYQLCCQALALEFDALPEPATVALYEQIRLNPAG